MKICWFGIYKKEYPRNAILMAGLRANEVEIVECHAEWNNKSRYLDLWKNLRSLNGDYDFVYAGYPGTIPVILAKILSRKLVVLDAFYSMYDAVVNDRKEVKWFHPRAIKLALFDWLAIICADIVITDTEAHKAYWGSWPFANKTKMKTVYLGADTSIYHPIERSASENDSNKAFIAHFHGHYIPVQGVEVIVRSAILLKDDNSIKFNLIGSGQDSKKIQDMISENNLGNIEQIGRILPSELNKYLNMASVVLGIFGDVDRASRVIPNKVYEGMAVGKPVITMDSPAIREIFDDNDIFLTKNNPEELVKAIKCIQNDSDFAKKLTQNGSAKIQAQYNPSAIGVSLLKILNEFTE